MRWAALGLVAVVVGVVSYQTARPGAPSTGATAWIDAPRSGAEVSPGPTHIVVHGAAAELEAVEVLVDGRSLGVIEFDEGVSFGEARFDWEVSTEPGARLIEARARGRDWGPADRRTVFVGGELTLLTVGTEPQTTTSTATTSSTITTTTSTSSTTTSSTTSTTLATTTTADFLGPVITDIQLTPLDLIEQCPNLATASVLTVTARITDSSGVGSTDVLWWLSDTTVSGVEPMSHVGGDVYEGSILFVSGTIPDGQPHSVGIRVISADLLSIGSTGDPTGPAPVLQPQNPCPPG